MQTFLDALYGPFTLKLLQTCKNSFLMLGISFCGNFFSMAIFSILWLPYSDLIDIENFYSFAKYLMLCSTRKKLIQVLERAEGV